jgi:hypothetical protein
MYGRRILQHPLACNLICPSFLTQEFFESFVREIKQCCSGERVEKIEGDQKKKAIYTLLAPEGTGGLCDGSVLAVIS